MSKSPRIELQPDPAWSQALKDDLRGSVENGCVGTELVSENNRVRVWSLRLAPGERIGFHRHVLDYFWTVLTNGRALSHYSDGRTVETAYRAGETRHMDFAEGESMIHDLENTGETDLLFTTVEHLDSANPPLPVPDRVRRASAA